jgi:hypothetical protein
VPPIRKLHQHANKVGLGYHYPPTQRSNPVSQPDAPAKGHTQHVRASGYVEAFGLGGSSGPTSSRSIDRDPSMARRSDSLAHADATQSGHLRTRAPTRPIHVKKRAARNPAGWIALIAGLAGWDRDCTLCLPPADPVRVQGHLRAPDDLVPDVARQVIAAGRLSAPVSGRGSEPRSGSKGRSRAGRMRAGPAAKSRPSRPPNGRPRPAPSPASRWTAPQP